MSIATTLNSRRQLRRYAGGTSWSMLDTGVLQVEWADDGLIYELNNRRQLKRLSVSGVWTTLDTDIKSFKRDADGILYSLNTSHQLKQLKSIDLVDVGDFWALKKQRYSLKWKVIASNVDTFVVAPSQFNDVYVLSRTKSLKRLEAGVWIDLKSGIKFLSMESNGLVHARDVKNTSWFFAPTYVAEHAGPADGDNSCTPERVPTDAEILKAAHIPPSQETEIAIAPLIDQTDSPMLFPVEKPIDHVDSTAIYAFTDMPAEVHRCHYQATINFATRPRRKPVNLYVDRNQLTRVADRELHHRLGWEDPDAASDAIISQKWMK